MTINSVSSLGFADNPIFINSENVKKVKEQTNLKKTEIKDTFSTTTKQGGKVSFKEGAKLIGKGFIDKIKETGKAIVEHPALTLGAVAGTTIILSALPLIGISAVTGAAILALGFAGYAIYNTGKDAIETYRANKEGRYDDVRKGLEKIGGDSVDAALSLPFAPKAVNQISRFSKFGKSTIGLNKDLISKLKDVKNIPAELGKADTVIKYEMIGKEMGLKVKPKLDFHNFASQGSMRIIGAYEPTTGTLQVNSNNLTLKGKLISKIYGIDDMEIVLRHELEHFRQFSDVARAEELGIDSLSGNLTKYYDGILKQTPIENLEKSGFARATVENMTTGDKSALNRAFYNEVINANGTIKTGTKEAELAKQYADGLLEKIYPKAENIAKYNEEVKGINPIIMTPFDKIKLMSAQLKLYKSNILEKEAYEVQDVYRKIHLKRRPGIGIVNTQEISTIENQQNKTSTTA